MRGPLFVLVLLVPASLAAQQGTAPVRTDADAGQALFERGFRKDSATISVVEVMPAFPGGEPELYRRIKEETRYPKEALRDGITGRVMVHFVVEQDGRVDWVTLSLGGRASKLMVGSDVCAPRAHAQLSGVFFADRDQHFDQRTLQLHTSPHTTSYLLYKGAVKDTGRSVYQGVINAKPGAIDVDAYQMNNNLILNEGARADSLPGLEIDADDLKCSHGSTMGTLDPEQLFYLQSRGLPAAEARRLVVAGFFEEVISQVPHAFVQERLREHIQLKMGDGA